MPRAASVLVVDDNVDAADALAEILRAHGYTAHVAYDGAEAVATARSVAVDVALLDLDLPIIGGYEVARLMNEERADAPVRLIALSGYGARENVEQSRAAGFAAHLVKPIDLDELLRQLGALGSS
jgi:CheY-like chemotaxis protein